MSSEQPTRRDFIYVASAAFAGVGAAAAAWPLIDEMNPDASVLALASIEVDLSPIDTGQSITIQWRGKPVFVRHRTREEIAEAESVPLDDLPDPQPDEDRIQRPEWLVMIGSCTHLGCVPLGQKGDFDGWFCPCHGSHYDTSGRIRKGPAPSNLEIPPYQFVSENRIRIG
ncbi:MAG: ubiquinol-cytochrome c reductase iron-sulfur subunit [Hyphomicrobiales bacterium]|nr:ubiquinol-cytochrome c reductase iron-sulfur subunit [Hyphomicrobiales bacterium]MCY4038271.1 ubiquinol-cytochrome c reductase iron-sulfur subunit [Hyphomicrobiales bacterium]